jgi:hypothetical protein
MNPLIRLKLPPSVFLIVLGVVWLGLLPTTQAVIPAPDGGYPGGNTAEGQGALFSLTSGSGGFNTAVGFFSLRSNATNSLNTAIGAGALLANTADQNTANGAGALLSNTTGFQNTANGAFALFSNTSGQENTANGVNALFANTIGASNTANGAGALASNITGGGNTASGAAALNSNTTGQFNTAIGNAALGFNTTGSNNIALGFGAGTAVTTANNVIAINSGGANVTGTCFIGSVRGVTTQNADALPVLIDSAGQLGTASSSRRYKTDIKSIDKASESILALKPVTFHYKSDKTNRPEFGLIAEEVAAVNPALVVRDKNGEIYTVRYDAVNAMLLNEFLKEHKKVEEQQATIGQLKAAAARQETINAQQQKGMEALAATVKEQAAQIQKVSAQFELSTSPLQTALSTQ